VTTKISKNTCAQPLTSHTLILNPTLTEPNYTKQHTIVSIQLSYVSEKFVRDNVVAPSLQVSAVIGGAGTNLKVGATVRSESGGQGTGTFLVVPLHFLALKTQLVVFGERFS